jgi:hypothetical protein
MSFMQNIERSFFFREPGLECYPVGQESLHRVDADRRMKLTLDFVEQERRLLIGIEARHPRLEIDMPNGDIRIV